MATYTVTTANWNNPSFLSSNSQGSSGQTLDFSQLPSNFSVNFDVGGNITWISDGTTTVTVGEQGTSGTDANIGSGTDWSFFNIIFGSHGNDILSGSENADTIDGGAGNDTPVGGSGADSISGDDGDDTIFGDAAVGSIATIIGSDFTSGWTGRNSTLGSDRAVFFEDYVAGTAAREITSGMSNGPGGGGGALLTLDFVCSDSANAASRGVSTFRIVYGGVEYARITTPDADGSTAIVTYLNGASGSSYSLSEGTTEYIAQGFVRDLNYELESGSLAFQNPTVSNSGTPVAIRFLDNDGVLDGDTLAVRQ